MSKYKGVSSQKNLFKVRLISNGVIYYKNRIKTIEKAAKIYDKIVITQNLNRILNFPEEEDNTKENNELEYESRVSDIDKFERENLKSLENKSLSDINCDNESCSSFDNLENHIKALEDGDMDLF